jgi:hypothetical protein
MLNNVGTVFSPVLCWLQSRALSFTFEPGFSIGAKQQVTIQNQLSSTNADKTRDFGELSGYNTPKFRILELAGFFIR